MKWLIPLFMAVIACKAISLMELQLTEWEEFKIKYGKKYATAEEDEFRMNIYQQKKLEIEKHNLAYLKGVHSYELGMNQFGDLLPHEVHQITDCMKNVKEGPRKVEKATFISPANINLPAQIDWREKGAVTVVKNQRDCASCWAFSATGSLEGQQFRKSGKLIRLSEQNLVDCTFDYDNKGCKGGWMDHAFQYVKDNGGIDTSEAYIYESEQGKCRFNASGIGATISNIVILESANETQLMEAVATVGPISVVIQVTKSFPYYTKGVFYDESCTGLYRDINHAVLVVGYGSEDGKDYWIVKNSWGFLWGKDGYVKMARNKNNNCGIALMATYPLV